MMYYQNFKRVEFKNGEEGYIEYVPYATDEYLDQEEWSNFISKEHIEILLKLREMEHNLKPTELVSLRVCKDIKCYTYNFDEARAVVLKKMLNENMQENAIYEEQEEEDGWKL